MSSPDGLFQGWLATLAFTFGVSSVVLLRQGCRRLFGAELAILLWLIPLLAMAATWLPHLRVAPLPALAPVVLDVTQAAGPWVHPVTPISSMHLSSAIILAIWLSGVALVLLVAAGAQWRYRQRLRDAIVVRDADVPWPVLRAAQSDMGPALVGAWRPRIVLPADFEQRYDMEERRLILAHEATHARRRDGWWCLIGQVVASLFWFHPMAWWGLRALRQDLELACDAAVLRTNGALRATYARAMLKIPFTGALLPVGCSWSSRHPITERIVMLKRIQPGRTRRAVGYMSVGVLSAALSVVVYASTGPGDVTYHPGQDVVTKALAGARHAQDALAASTSRPSGNPASNAALGLPAPESGAFGPAIKRLEIAEGGHVLVTLADSKGAVAGHLDLAMHPVEQIGSVGWSCFSADIPDVQKLAASCTYMPGIQGKTADLMSVDRFTLEMTLSINGKLVDHADKICLKTADTYHFSNAEDVSRPPLQGAVRVQPIAGGQVEIQGDLAGGAFQQPIHPRLHAFPGQAGTIQVGERIGGDHPQDHTVKLDLTATPGCA